MTTPCSQLLIPVYLFVCGQLEKLTEIPRPTPAHLHIVLETRDILLWLAGQLGWLSSDTCEAARSIFFLEEPYDRHHRISRRNLLKAVLNLLKALQKSSQLSYHDIDPQPVRIALENVLKGKSAPGTHQSFQCIV